MLVSGLPHRVIGYWDALCASRPAPYHGPETDHIGPPFAHQPAHSSTIHSMRIVRNIAIGLLLIGIQAWAIYDIAVGQPRASVDFRFFHD